MSVIGHGDASGSTLLFNEIGRYSGETVAEAPELSPMLVAVEADGAWSLDFTE